MQFLTNLFVNKVHPWLSKGSKLSKQGVNRLQLQKFPDNYEQFYAFLLLQSTLIPIAIISLPMVIIPNIDNCRPAWTILLILVPALPIAVIGWGVFFYYLLYKFSNKAFKDFLTFKQITWGFPIDIPTFLKIHFKLLILTALLSIPLIALYVSLTKC